MHILPMLFGTFAVLNSKHGTVVQTAQAHHALLLNPFGFAVFEPNGGNRAAFGTQATPNAGIFNRKMLCFTH